MPLQEPTAESQGGRCFATTHWSVVLAAGQGDSELRAQALAKLCQAYWYPLYVYVRRRGYSPEDAKDLTQGFFLALLEKDSLSRAERSKGRFRTFLLSSINYFLHGEWDRAVALKRGGGRRAFSWDQLAAEGRYQKEPVEDFTPAKLFEKRWAATLIERVLQQLREEFVVSGKMELFEQLERHLWGDADSVPYADLARELNLTVVAIKSTVHRIRKRCRELLRQEIAQTVCTAAEVEEEIQYLLQVFSETQVNPGKSI